MFKDEYLQHHLDFSQSLSVESAVFMELNQTDSTNVSDLGVFKNDNTAATTTAIAKWEPPSPNYYYRHEFVTSYMNQDVLDEEVVYFGRRDKGEYFNLADCFTEFRPRSGILKAVRPLSNGQVYVDNFWSANRPRYYYPSINDNFKYWTSWNTDVGPTTGLSDAQGNIKDAAPFIVYKEPRPVNRVTVKIQTGIGIEPKPVLANRNPPKADPLIDVKKSSIPEKAVIEYLNAAGTWERLFDIQIGSEIFPHDNGTIDLAYMVKNPTPTSTDQFVFKGFLGSAHRLPRANANEEFVYAYDGVNHLPDVARNGDAWCVDQGPEFFGTLYVRENYEWVDRGPIEYEWRLINPSTDNPENYAVRNYVDPKYYNETPTVYPNPFLKFHEFVMMWGIRMIVTKMHAPSRAFDLIELSPRLLVNISDSVIDYTIDKAVSEDDVLPVGELSVSNGNITVDNSKLMFNKESAVIFDYRDGLGSLVSDRVNKNTKITFFNIIRNVPKLNELYDYFIPIKTLYATEEPVVISGHSEASIPLRDLMFRFEENYCPNIVLKDCTLNKAVAVLLDSIGFSNYIFQFKDDALSDDATSTVIPYFFANEDLTIAESLQSLAMATQCAMFFDEYNNFLVMPRKHFGVPSTYTLRGSNILQADVDKPDSPYTKPLGRANIEEISSVSLDMIADVEIKYTPRNLNREMGNVNQMEVFTYNQAGFDPGEKTSLLKYQLTPLWDSSKIEDFTGLSMAVLNTTLTGDLPVYNPTLADRFANITIDVGLWSTQMPYQGMIMMNGEIIKYDAKQVSMGGRKYWVSSASEFTELQNNVSNISGKTMFDQAVFETGLLRIWVDVEQTTPGAYKIVRHGRNMYDKTGITRTRHEANTGWLTLPVHKQVDTMLTTVYPADATVRQNNLNKYNFVRRGIPTTTTTDTKSTNYIFNSIHSQYNVLSANPIFIDPTRVQENLKNRRIMRSSALTFAGPANATADTIYKKIIRLTGTGYSTFGCRLGILGRTDISKNDDDEETRNQSPYGQLPLGSYTTGGKAKAVYGSGGGLCLLTSRTGTANPLSNDGYYFQIDALDSEFTVGETEQKPTAFVANINFYKINHGDAKPGSGVTGGNVAIPLYSTYKLIQVSSGSQYDRSRLPTSNNGALIHDLAVDVKEVKMNNFIYRTFYLYLDGALLATVPDVQNRKGYLPLRYSNTEVGIFVRGRSTVQFEHIYAIGNDINDPTATGYNTDITRRTQDFKAYSPSAIWSSRALMGGPTNNYRYFEEFGSVARECRKVVAKFEPAPAFVPTVQQQIFFDRSYALTHFESNPYGASFMLWSQADALINLTDPATQIYIGGITLSDNEQQVLKLDDYLIGQYPGSTVFDRLNSGVQKRTAMLALRQGGQVNTISYDSAYIQSSNFARKLMKWFAGFVGEERMRIELKTFGTHHLQLGDIVSIDYEMPYATEIEAAGLTRDEWNPTLNEFHVDTFRFYGNDKRFIVRKISVSGGNEGPETFLSLIELPSKSDWVAGEW